MTNYIFKKFDIPTNTNTSLNWSRTQNIITVEEVKVVYFYIRVIRLLWLIFKNIFKSSLNLCFKYFEF